MEYIKIRYIALLLGIAAIVAITYFSAWYILGVAIIVLIVAIILLLLGGGSED